MKKLIYILLLLFASSCKTKLSDNNLDILNINNPITLSFTDMVRDIKIVPLETLDDVLISDCELIIDKDYIICIDKNRILQFNANNGKFIRVLANKGNGPKEFNTIGSYSIYDGKLFYSEKFKSSKLNIIDLQNGDFLEPVNFESKNKINSLRFCGITSNGDLLIENDTVLLDVYNFDNQTYYALKEKNLSKLNSSNKNIYSSNNFSLQKVNTSSAFRNDYLLYNGGYSDTLYSFKNNLVTPLFNIYIPTKNGQVKDDSNVKSQTSYDLSIPYSGSSFFLISCIETLLDITPKNFSISINPRGLFYISTDKKRIAKVEKFIFDPLFIIDFPLRESNEDITPQSFFIEDVSVYNGPYFFGAYLDAYKLINYLELSQSNYNLNSEIIQKVNLLLSQINDDSNIVVIYGTKK